MRMTTQGGMYAAPKRKKSMYTGIAAVLIVALLIGGAFAWTDFTQSRTNKFRGTTDADATLHDEFDGVDKDVFVENSGTSPIFVRIKLDEYMEIGGKSFDPNADVKDKTTWMTHTYQGTDITDCGHVTTGALFHDYYTWEMSGAGRNFKEGTPGLVYSELGSNGKVDTVSGTPTAITAPAITMSKYLLLKADADSNTLSNPADIAAWKAVTETGCWILDDSASVQLGGGWAYWSIALQPGTATNMLLDKVNRTNADITDDWYYGIDVKMQAVTKSDLDKWSSDGNVASNAAKLRLFSVWQSM